MKNTLEYSVKTAYLYAMIAIIALFGLSPIGAFAAPISIASTTPGPTPFINYVTATYTGDLDSVTFAVLPKTGSIAHPLIATYSATYLATHGSISNGSVTFSVFGLYAGMTNNITLVFVFKDHSYTIQQTSIITAPWTSPCGNLNMPTFTANPSASSRVTFSYFLLKALCGPSTGIIVDVDGNTRWASTNQFGTPSQLLYDNALYTSDTSGHMYRVELTDGLATQIGDYTPYNVTSTGAHNIDFGRDGLLVEADTTTQIESVNLEIDPKTGKVLNRWDLSDIISAAMVAGGDDPSIFVGGPKDDWFHNNAATYNPKDNTMIISSRENFVIAVDYDAPAEGQRKIHWILGDPSKAWYQYPSLRKYALALSPTTIPPVGQHAVSIDEQGRLLLFDDGLGSRFQIPAGITRTYSAAREYIIDTSTMSAREEYTYDAGQSIYSSITSSVYEANGTYLVDFAQAKGGTAAIIQGIGPNHQVAFTLEYPGGYSSGWNAQPLPSNYFLFK